MSSTIWKSRWAAVGAAVAITLGAGGIGIVDATKSSGERAVYTAIEPCRVLDTRPAKNIQRNTPLGAGEAYAVSALGDNGECTGIPSDAVALELNVTGLLNTAATDFVIWSGAGGAGSAPNASQLNLALGASPTPNSVTTEVNGTSFSIKNKFGTAHVIIDIVGVYQDHNHDDRYDDAQGAVWFDDSVTGLTGTAQVIGSVTVDTPTSGYVVVNSGGYLFSNSSGTGRCSITTGTTMDSSALIIAELAPPDVGFSSMAGTRGFTINKAILPANSNEATYNLVCDLTTGSVSLVDPQLNATFVPDPDAFGFIIVPFPDEAPSDPAADGFTD